MIAKQDDNWCQSLVRHEVSSGSVTREGAQLTASATLNTTTSYKYTNTQIHTYAGTEL